jgi:hypothetical protein
MLTDGQPDKWIDGRTDGRGKKNMSPKNSFKYKKPTVLQLLFVIVHLGG